MSDKGFYDIDSYQALLAKCSYELSRLPLVAKAQPSDSYTLFNLVLTLNHLFEWVVNDEDIREEGRIECVKQFNPYREEQRKEAERSIPIYKMYSFHPFPQTNPQQWLTRHRAKHLKASPRLGKFDSTILREERELAVTWFVVDDIEGHPTELIGQCQLLHGSWTRFVSELP